MLERGENARFEDHMPAKEKNYFIELKERVAGVRNEKLKVVLF